VREHLKAIHDGRNTFPGGSISGDIGNCPEVNYTTNIEPAVLKQMFVKDQNDGVKPWFDGGNTIDLTPEEEE
jgi:hypothetical protein